MKKISLILSLVLLTSVALKAQEKPVNVISDSQEYNSLAYSSIIKKYQSVFEKNTKDIEVLKKLSNAYYFNANYQKAEAVYKQLFALTSDVAPEYLYRYAQCLKTSKKYEEADKYLRDFYSKSTNDKRAKLAIIEKDYLNTIYKNSGRYNIEDSGINTNESEYGGAFYNGKLVFTSSRKQAELPQKKAAWTGLEFTDLYTASIDSVGKLSDVQEMPNNINSKYNEDTPIFTKDGNTVYFTRNNFFKGVRKSDDKKVTKLKIYTASFKDGKWMQEVELPFNSDQYNVAHPALSVDEKTLYFASDMPGSFGQSDLYRVSIEGNNTYGALENLGSKINTEGRETFPNISADGILFFASDGYPGLGGLDVYACKLESNDSYGVIKNIGEPVNSSYDDFGFIYDKAKNIGYLTSNRAGGKGNDDIYKLKYTFVAPIVIPCNQILSGIISDVVTQQPLAYAQISLFDDKLNLIATLTSDANGNYNFGKVDCEKKLILRASKALYLDTEKFVTIDTKSGTTIVPLQLKPEEKKYKVGDDLAKILSIEMIYFDLNKSFIRPDAALELTKILNVMRENPLMVIDIRSHTDSRSSFKYNADLSNRRAKSTMAWLVAQGIDKKRLSAKGYGESRLVNRCKDGVKCSEVEHQLNRRSEFIIVKN